MLVLQLNVLGETSGASPREAPLRTRAFEAAARHLIRAGLVEAQQVGLMGFSRNGFYVEYALTHSTFPYAAAIAADHWDPSYTAQTLVGYDMGGADVNDGLPFGEHLPQWLANAPGFNADRVHTPLLQIEQSHGLLGALLHWEMFSRLRYLKKPVELWVMPNAAFGVHNTQNPEQIVALQTRAIDWFRFWLGGYEDADPTKHEQYARWRELRDLQAAQRTGEE
jgi:dipeptidyl aminopeptidase/acylaminoacyl peptidase